MQKGARRLCRGTISSELKKVLITGVREGRFSLRSIAFSVGFPDPQTFGRQLHSEFPTSTRTMTRWKRVAECVGFTGEPFEKSSDDFCE